MGTCYSLSPQSITPVHLGNIIIHQQQEQLQDQPHRNDRQPQLEEACGRQSSTKCSGDSGFKSSGSPTEPPQSVHGFLEDIFLDDRTVCTEHDNQRADNYLPSRMDLHPTSLREEVSRFDEAPGEEAEPLRERSCYSEFPSLSNSTVAVYAKRRVSTKGLPRPGSTDSTFACVLRLRKILQLTEENRITKRVLLENLNYALDVVTKTYIEETKRLRDEDDELSETACSEVPDEVRDWLATTFTRHQSNGGRPITKPRFRSVVNAIRAGIVVERIYRRMSSCTCLTLPPNVVLLLKSGLDEWNFNVFEFNEVSANHALKYVGFELLHKYNLIAKFQLDSTKLENLLLRLEIGYSKYKNPYHNLMHATDVAQTCHVILTTSRLRDYLSDLDIFAVIYAALIHDFEHSGTTNNFHIQTQTELALLYNDRNVLENYHVSAVFRITSESEFNIFEKMPKEQYQEFRTAVIDMVLNTDMSLHFSQAKIMKNLIAIPEIIDKLKALSLLVHCADIAHPCKEWALHKEWSNLLSEEFFRQGDRENELGMPYSPLCDRNTVVLQQSQIGFIDFIVEPIFVVLGDMLDKMMEHAVGAKVDGDDGEKENEGETKRESIDSCEGIQIPVLRPWVVHLKENKENWGKELKQLEESKESAKAKNEKKTEKTDGEANLPEQSRNGQEQNGGYSPSSFESIEFIDRDGIDESEPMSSGQTEV